MPSFKNFPLPQAVLLVGALAISACGREAPPVAAVQADTTGEIKKVLEEPATVAVDGKTVPDKPLPESVDHHEEREEAERIQLEALQANAPAYEAGFDKAARIFKEALKRGRADLDRFVARKASEFKIEVERKGVKGGKEWEEADSRMDAREALLSEFVKNVENPTFTYSLNGTTVTVQFYDEEWDEDFSLWQDYLWKSIAGSFIYGRWNPDFDVGFRPEGDSDAEPGPRISIIIKGNGVYQFRVMSEQGDWGGIDGLYIDFGATRGSEPQAMEELTAEWNAPSYGTIEDRVPPKNTENYSCLYNPDANSVVNLTGYSGAEAQVPKRMDNLWPLRHSFSN